jgi:hypothetical protein
MFRFSIRELLLVIAIIALTLGWVVDRSRLANTNYELITQRNRLVDTKAQMVIYRESLQAKLQQVRSAGSDAP